MIKSLPVKGIYDSLENFEIFEIIGRGTFSVVHKARCKKDGQLVALKKIALSEMESAKCRSDCIREIDLLMRVRHPNVINYFSSIFHKGQLYIILELAEAGDLSKMFQYFKNQGRLIPEVVIWKLFSQITEAIKHMHSCRVMHRDVKPENVFVTRDGSIKLGDLGLGRYFSHNTVAAHTLVGTPYYMSPERMCNEGYDFKSDLWSLGCVLYEFATLQSPFCSEKYNLFILIQKISRCDYPPIPYSGYTNELHSLISKCLVADPEERAEVGYILEFSKDMYHKLSQKLPHHEQNET